MPPTLAPRDCRRCGTSTRFPRPLRRVCDDCQWQRSRELQVLRKAHPISDAVRRLVYERDQGRCQRCGRDTEPTKYHRGAGALPHVDHRQPLHRGGTSDIANLQLLCEKCNLSKGCR